MESSWSVGDLCWSCHDGPGQYWPGIVYPDATGQHLRLIASNGPTVPFANRDDISSSAGRKGTRVNILDLEKGYRQMWIAEVDLRPYPNIVFDEQISQGLQQPDMPTSSLYVEGAEFGGRRIKENQSELIGTIEEFLLDVQMPDSLEPQGVMFIPMPLPRQPGGTRNEWLQAVRNAKRLAGMSVKDRLTHIQQVLSSSTYTKCLVNRPVWPVQLVQRGEAAADVSPCGCHPTDANPCGSATCQNWAAQIECSNLNCPAGDRCRNQRFQQGVGPALVVCQRPNTGWGLMTADNAEVVQRGTFIIEFVGELIDVNEYDCRLVAKGDEHEPLCYVMQLNHDRLIDSEEYGNEARFVNHSCEPNCEAQVWQVEGNDRVGLFALHDIQPGTELTFHYNFGNNGESQKVCHCGSPRCAGFIGAKYVEPKAAQSRRRPDRVKARKRRRSRSRSTGPAGKRSRSRSTRPAGKRRRSADG